MSSHPFTFLIGHDIGGQGGDSLKLDRRNASSSANAVNVADGRDRAHFRIYPRQEVEVAPPARY